MRAAFKVTREDRRWYVDNAMGGVEYTMEGPSGPMLGWLCPVFWHYFPTAPARLFVSIEKIS